MNNKKKQEIPLEAFDNELIHQEIIIPDDFKATIEGNKIILTKTENKDERIKNRLIKLIKMSSEVGGFALHKWEADEMLAWLEKQGREKPADNVESKFKVGDWITDDEDEAIFHITSYDIDYGYQLETVNGTSFHYSDETIEKKYRLWTIQDAKDGDVLLFEGYYNSIVLFQGIGINGKGRINYHCKCDLGNYSYGIQGDAAYLGTIEKDAEHYHPATKEQRNLLFQKMKEAGYEWDAEKKELKLLITNGGDFFESENCEQKPAWSEEDEKRIKDIIYFLDTAKKHYASTVELDACINWLKSLKERIGGE